MQRKWVKIEASFPFVCPFLTLLPLDMKASFPQGLFAAVFPVTISYSEITSWGLLQRFGPLRCRESSLFTWWDCHGDRLSHFRSCRVRGIHNPQTCLWAGQCSYQGHLWKSFSPSFWRAAVFGKTSSWFLSGHELSSPMDAAAFVPVLCCFVLLGLNGSCKKLSYVPDL